MEDVKFVRWPVEAHLRNDCKREGRLCLLVVEGGAQPPHCLDPHEDWVRPPIARPDLLARVNTLQLRARGCRTPVLDSTGTLYFDSRWVSISAAQTGLMELFVERFQEVVYRTELEEQLAQATAKRPTRNSLDLQIMRLRRRLERAGLAIRTAWGRGYLLDPMSQAEGQQPPP